MPMMPPQMDATIERGSLAGTSYIPKNNIATRFNTQLFSHHTSGLMAVNSATCIANHMPIMLFVY
eukprot:scaffold476630_cov33-Prasinocladus_malaysianus.AAC.1